jgi:disulfide bond formation protein DsbB
MWENAAMRIPNRLVFVAIAVACIALDLTAIFYFQEELGLEPCPMCILSRMTFMAIAAVSLVAAIHNPRGTALQAYGGLIAVLGLVGIGISTRHSYLQHFPPAVESCGADLSFMMNNLPLAQALPKIFAGTGSCSKVDWSLFGISIPEWALVWYAGFVVVALAIAFSARKDKLRT